MANPTAHIFRKEIREMMRDKRVLTSAFVGPIFLIVIMLVNLDESARVRQFNKQWWLALACVAAVTGELLFFVSKGTGGFRLAETTAAAAGKVGNTERIADVLFSQYLLPFELASVLLLAAVIGSVFVARKKV